MNGKAKELNVWSVLFETKDWGMTHPIRFSNLAKNMTKKEARKEAVAYLDRNRSWLKRIQHMSLVK